MIVAMERDVGDFEAMANGTSAAPSGKPPLSGAELREALERARASYAAGGGVEHDVVSLWLRTWGQPNRRPFRDWLAAPDG